MLFPIWSVMPFAQRIMDDVFVYFEVIFSSKKGQQIVQKALDNDFSALANDLLEFYSSDKKLFHDLEKDEYSRLALEYNKELQQAAEFLKTELAEESKSENYFVCADSLASTTLSIDPSHRAPIKYSLYLNTKQGILLKFLKDFFKEITSKKVYCPVCSAGSFFDKEAKKIVCKKCGNENFFFAVKIHEPIMEDQSDIPEIDKELIINEDVVLRRDKVKMGFADTQMLKSIILLLKSLKQSYFSKLTPYFTNQIMPGVGATIQASKTEEEDYKKAMQQAEEIFSFEKFLTFIIAENFVKLASSERIFLQGALAKAELEDQDPKLLYRIIKQKIIPSLEEMIKNDSRLQRLFSEIEKIRQELDSN